MEASIGPQSPREEEKSSRLDWKDQMIFFKLKTYNFKIIIKSKTFHFYHFVYYVVSYIYTNFNSFGNDESNIIKNQQ